MSVELLYVFQNEKKVFAAADHSYKQTLVVATRGGKTNSFAVFFRLGVTDSPQPHEIEQDVLKGDAHALRLTPNDAKENSPETYALTELRTTQDMEVFRSLYLNAFRLGEAYHSWKFDFSQDFNMTTHSKLFIPANEIEERKLFGDEYGSWTNHDGEMFLPLVEGSMIHQFDPTYQRWESGFGSSSIWRYIERDKKQCLPRYVINATHVAERNEFTHRARLAFRTVARNTHTRTMLATYIPPLGCGNSVSTLRVSGGSIDRTLFAVAVFNSFCFDFVVRLRNAGLNQNWFIIKECPFPKVDSSDPRYSLVVDCAARVNFIHRRFALEWLVLKKKMGYGPTVQWKYRWAVATSKWVRSRICCDALVADLFGVTPSQYRWIVREDLSESKGFWRVDKELPYEARLTGLSARAFQTLKEGKWSAETAAELSNDEFFEILGIPELTNAEAAKAKGLSGPLILKRKGCHSWHPENFPEDDPRHGWTWDDCRKDAIALLGSEEAVEEYIAKATGDGSEGEEDEEPFQLISDPAEKKNPQRRLF